MKFKNIKEIKIAVDKGLIVFWSDLSHRIIKDTMGHYLISFNGIILTELGSDELPNVNIDGCFYPRPRTIKYNFTFTTASIYKLNDV